MTKTEFLVMFYWLKLPVQYDLVLQMALRKITPLKKSMTEQSEISHKSDSKQQQQ